MTFAPPAPTETARTFPHTHTTLPGHDAEKVRPAIDTAAVLGAACANAGREIPVDWVLNERFLAGYIEAMEGVPAVERMTAGEALREIEYPLELFPHRLAWSEIAERSREEFEDRAQLNISRAAAIRARMGEGDGWQPIETSRTELWDTQHRLVWCPERQNTYVVTWRDPASGGEPYWAHAGSGYRLTEAPSHWLPWSAIPEPPQ